MYYYKLKFTVIPRNTSLCLKPDREIGTSALHDCIIDLTLPYGQKTRMDGNTLINELWYIIFIAVTLSII